MALLLLVSGFVQATVHIGGHNPLAEAWRITSGDTGVGGDGDFPGIYAWQINSNVSGRLRYESDGPVQGQSWVYSVRLRVVTLGDAVDSGINVEAANGSQRFVLSLGSDADGAGRSFRGAA